MIPSDFSVSVTGTPPSVDERLGQRQPEAHVDAALDLALEERRVHRPPDVVGRDDPRQAALVVEDHDLGRPAVGEVGHRILDPRRRAWSSSRRRTRRANSRPARSRRPGARAAAPSSAARSSRAASATARPPSVVAREAVVSPVSSSRSVSTTHADARRVDAQLLGHDLGEDRVDALAHLGPGVPQGERPVGARRGGSPGRARPSRCRSRRSSPRRRSRRTGRRGRRRARRAASARGRRPGPAAGRSRTGRRVRSAFRQRISQPSMPTRSARRSRQPSMANVAWGTPKPRKAPDGGLFV